MSRENDLQAIGDVVEHWLDWVTTVRAGEGLTTDAHTHVILQGSNAPPCWPHVGQLRRWLTALRNTEIRPSPSEWR